MIGGRPKATILKTKDRVVNPGSQVMRTRFVQGTQRSLGSIYASYLANLDKAESEIGACRNVILMFIWHTRAHIFNESSGPCHESVSRRSLPNTHQICRRM
jgi:hypothetical protein